MYTFPPKKCHIKDPKKLTSLLSLIYWNKSFALLNIYFLNKIKLKPCTKIAFKLLFEQVSFSLLFYSAWPNLGYGQGFTGQLQTTSLNGLILSEFVKECWFNNVIKFGFIMSKRYSHLNIFYDLLIHTVMNMFYVMKRFNPFLTRYISCLF